MKVSADTPSFTADAWSRVPVDVDGGAAAEVEAEAAAAERAFAMAKGSVAAGAPAAAARLPLASAVKVVEAMAGWGNIHAGAPVLAGGIKEEAFARSIIPFHWH